MTTLTVGATGDYSTFGNLLTYLRGIDPLGDDYRIVVQDETFNELVTWDVDDGGNDVTIEAAPGASPIIDAEATRANCLAITGGGLRVKGLQFEDSTGDAVTIGAAVTGACEFLGCRFYRFQTGIADGNNDQDLLVQGCYFEDADVKAVAAYSYNGLKVIRGCHVHWTSSGPTADFAVEFDGTGDANCVIEGCRITTDDVTKGPAHGIFGANYTVDRCKVFNPRGSFFRAGWGSTFVLRRSLASASAGSCYHGVYSTGGTTWTILNCLIRGAGRSYTGVRVTGGSTVTIKNTGFLDLSSDSAVDTDAGTTVDNSYNGYYNCATKVGGGGSWNNPETGEVTTDPTEYGDDGDLIPEGSPWEGAGTDVGLPYPGTAPDIGCEELMPANLMES